MQKWISREKLLLWRRFSACSDEHWCPGTFSQSCMCETVARSHGRYVSFDCDFLSEMVAERKVEKVQALKCSPMPSFRIIP